MSSRPTVAVLGAGGTMGFAMAGNLARAGFSVRAWDRSREKAEPLTGDGAAVVDTPADAARGASIVVTIVSDLNAVLAVMDGPHGFLSNAREGLIWVQMSTIGLGGTERCAELAHSRDVCLVDAPVLGTKAPAEEGKLIVLGSGPAETREQLEELFAAIGKKTMWVGEAGAGSRLKLVINAWILALLEGIAETIALAEGAGIDPELFLEAVSSGPLDLPYLQTKARAMLERKFEPTLRLALAAKDAKLAVELAESHDLDLPLIRTIALRLAEAVPVHGEEDMAATYLTSAPTHRTR
jgi:3-hydroxyisobutyrate dehydrogenase